MHPCASAVGTVVRSPRSEVSERPRAGKLGVGGVTFVELDAGPPQGGGIGGRRKQTLQLVSTERPHRPRLLLYIISSKEILLLKPPVHGDRVFSRACQPDSRPEGVSPRQLDDARIRLFC